MDSYMAGTPVPQQNAYPWPMEEVKVKECTLLIKHLPEAISHEALSRLLSNCGASSIRPCTTGRMRNCAFVDFKDESLAHQAQQQLNGIRFLGKTLAVERASRSLERDNQESKPRIGDDTTSLFQDAAAKEFGKGSRAGPYPGSEPIAERLGVDYPFPPHLEYVYPAPDGHILTNIVNALIAVPRFYTQVLHLMNKMNIPAPFRMALPTPPLPTSMSVPPPPPPPPPPTVSKSRMEDLSSSESEMESSDEEARKNDGPKQKRIKHEAILGPGVDKDVAHEAVGVRTAALVPTEMPVIKKKNPIIKQIKVAPKQVQSEEKGDVSAIPLPVEDVEQSHKPFATLEEIKSGRLPPEEILSLPRFKNYSAGNPSQILYLKNLAKEVSVDDIYFIFGSLFGSIDEAKSSLAVKLMQEGRMRGQAFVTFPSVELAQNALNLVNGYVFKAKPIVIQFGRDPAKAKTS